jgi:hypothetical protein
MEAKVTAHFHELFKSRYIINKLGLDEIGTCRNLFGKPGGPVFIWKGKGVGSCPEEEPRLAALDFLAALELLEVPHIPHHAKQLDGIHVKNTLGAGMVAEFLVISGKAEQVFQAKGACPQDITLHADSVPVAACHLDYRLDPFGLSEQTGSNTGHSDNSGLTIGNVDCINAIFQNASFFPYNLGVTVFGRTEFSGYSKFTRGQYAF